MLRRTPYRSSGTSSSVEACTTVADEDVHRARGDLGVDVDPAGAGVLGGVGDRLASGLDDRTQRLVEVAVADRDHVDRDAVVVLDLGGRASAARPPRLRLVGGLAGVQPRPQVALLRAGQPGDGGRVVGALLDQGQGLQHRVVQVRGDVGPLLGADPLLALGAEVGGQPEHPRADHEGQPGDAEQPGDQRDPGLAERAAVDADDDQRDDHEHDARADPGVRRPAAGAEHHPDRVQPPRGVEPALALDLVGLPPQQRHAGQADHDRPEDRAAAERRLDDQDHAEASAASAIVGPASASRRTRPGRRPPREALSAPGVPVSNRESRRQHQPQAGVERDAQPAERGGDHEPGPHPQHRHAEVARQTAGDAAEDRRLGVAGGAPDLAARLGGCTCHDLPRIAERGPHPWARTPSRP